MLQLIGWLGCVYLLVKALEVGTDKSRYDPETGILDVSARWVVGVAVSAAFLFGIAFYVQGQVTPRFGSDAMSVPDYIDVNLS